MFFKAVVKEVLLFGLETWGLTPRIRRSLGSFQYRVARWITGKHLRQQEEGGREYPTLAAAMEEVGFEEIRVYILKRQITVAQYIATRSILELCERSVQRLGAWVYQKW